MGLSVSLREIVGIGVGIGVKIPPCMNLLVNSNTDTKSTKAKKATSITFSKKIDVGYSSLEFEMEPLALELETPMEIRI